MGIYIFFISLKSGIYNRDDVNDMRHSRRKLYISEPYI